MARILVVEDDGIIAMDTVRSLLEMGHLPVGVAKSGPSALQKVQEQKPDLVLMDIKLHGPMRGTEAAALINERFGTPVIYLTAHTDEATMHYVNMTVHCGILHKPLNPTLLCEALQRAFAKRAAALP